VSCSKKPVQISLSVEQTLRREAVDLAQRNPPAQRHGRHERREGGRDDEHRKQTGQRHERGGGGRDDVHRNNNGVRDGEVRMRAWLRSVGGSGGGDGLPRRKAKTLLREVVR
jgi:hypothetical protein